MKPFAIFPFLVVKSTAYFKGFTRPNLKDDQQHRSRETQQRLIKVYDNKKDFEAELESYDMVPMAEDFSSFLNGESQVNLNAGKTDVGLFDIVIKTNENRNGTNLGLIHEEDGGTFRGTYQKDEISVMFDYFSDATFYAFAASWDIDQEYDENALDEKLHIQLGSGLRMYQLNLVEYMHQQNTRFVGFIDDFEGFRSIELLTRNATGPITFSVNEIVVSTAEPKPDANFYNFLISSQEMAESLTGIFTLGGFFGPGGFYQEVIRDTLEFFFGEGGIFCRMVTRYVTARLFSDGEDER